MGRKEEGVQVGLYLTSSCSPVVFFLFFFRPPLPFLPMSLFSLLFFCPFFPLCSQPSPVSVKSNAIPFMFVFSPYAPCFSFLLSLPGRYTAKMSIITRHMMNGSTPFEALLGAKSKRQKQERLLVCSKGKEGESTFLVKLDYIHIIVHVSCPISMST